MPCIHVNGNGTTCTVLNDNIEREVFFFHSVLVEDSVLWRYDAMLVGNWFLTF